MTHRDEDEEIIDSALDTLAWQRREIDRLKGDVVGLREQLSGISGRLKVMREALIHTAGICNPASGFLKNATGVRKKHIENVCNIASAALGEKQ